MNVKLLTEHRLEFLSFKGGCTGLYESALVKMPHCWKSHAMAHMIPYTQAPENMVNIYPANSFSPENIVWCLRLLHTFKCDVQWLSRASDWESKGCLFEPHRGRCHCVLSLNKTLYPLLSACPTQEDPSRYE